MIELNDFDCKLAASMLKTVAIHKIYPAKNLSTFLLIHGFYWQAQAAIAKLATYDGQSKNSYR